MTNAPRFPSVGKEQEQSFLWSKGKVAWLVTEQEETDNIEQRRRKKKVTFGELLAYVHFYYFVRLRGKIMPTIRMLRNIQTFCIKWIFDFLSGLRWHHFHGPCFIFSIRFLDNYLLRDLRTHGCLSKYSITIIILFFADLCSHFTII